MKKNKIKIAIFNINPHNKIGGIESYTRLLIKSLDPKIYDVYEFYFFTQNENTDVCDNLLGSKSIPIVKRRKGKLKFLNYFNAAFIQRGWKKHKLNDFNIIIDNNIFNIFAPSPLINKKIRNKTIHVQHMKKDFYSISYEKNVRYLKIFLNE